MANLRSNEHLNDIGRCRINERVWRANHLYGFACKESKVLGFRIFHNLKPQLNVTTLGKLIKVTYLIVGRRKQRYEYVEENHCSCNVPPMNIELTQEVCGTKITYI
jgi:hypothetical protein